MSLVFMGTPAYVVPVLDALVQAGYQVGGVYTQPDRPTGRGRKAEAPPVKEYALSKGLAVYQPSAWRSPEVFQELADLEPEAIVVAAYGRLLPPEVAHLPHRACLNVHPSLLPKYRGPSPVVSALLEGEAITGVTLMVVDEGVDSGPIVAQRTVEVEDHDTGGSLTRRLFEVGARLVVETLPTWLAGEIEPVPQDHSQATVTKRIAKEDGQLDWRKSEAHLWRQVRALYPWPGTYTFWRGRLLKVLEASLSGVEGDGEPGHVLLLGNGREPRLGVVAGDGRVLELRRMQLEGRRPLGAAEFLQGHPDFIGSRLPL